MIERQSIRIVYREGQDKLAKGGIHDAGFDARALLSFAMGVPFSTLPLHYDDNVTEDLQKQYAELIDRRIKGEPLQYIIGEQEFMGLTFHVDPRVLIPRLDTEILAEEAVARIQYMLAHRLLMASKDRAPEIEPVRVLDLCCGSGVIGLSAAKLAADEDTSDHISLILADIDDGALEVAHQNASSLGISADFIKSDLFDSISGRFDLIVSNPPYVRSDVIPTLDVEVKDHEPMLALDGGADGLDIYRRIVKDAPDHLTPGGCLMMEIGYDQAEDVEELLRKVHDPETGCPCFDGIYVKKDLAGLDRVVIALLSGTGQNRS